MREISNLMLFLESLQQWIFGLRYLESSVKSQIGKKKLCTLTMLNYVTIIGGLMYAASIITLQSYCIVTFPGYYNDGSTAAFDEWEK